MGERVLPYTPMALTCSSDGYSGIEDLGKPAVTEMLLDWLDPFLTVEEQDRLLGSHPGGEPVAVNGNRLRKVPETTHQSRNMGPR